jgi:hypothetical protein
MKPGGVGKKKPGPNIICATFFAVYRKENAGLFRLSSWCILEKRRPF